MDCAQIDRLLRLEAVVRIDRRVRVGSHRHEVLVVDSVFLHWVVGSEALRPEIWILNQQVVDVFFDQFLMLRNSVLPARSVELRVVDWQLIFEVRVVGSFTELVVIVFVFWRSGSGNCSTPCLLEEA